jgi:hypothetical protein
MPVVPSTRPFPATRPVLRSNVSNNKHSPQQARVAREIALRWASARWPALLPAGSVLDHGDFERSLPGRAVQVTTGRNGTWTLSVGVQDRGTAAVWVTDISVADKGSTAVLSVETACSNVAAASVVSPPAVLGAFVDRLELDDGDVAVRGVPIMVQDEEQAERFIAEVVTARRHLHLVTLASKGMSRYYGVDPRLLAQTVKGLAHVACLSPAAVQHWIRRFGRSAAPAAGLVRIYVPGVPVDADGSAHPTFQPPDSRGAGPGDAHQPSFRQQLVRAICAASVSHERS